MPNGKRCKMSLGLELSLRASSFYIYDIIKIGRIAVAFLGNAADKRRMRTAWGSVHGIIKTMNGEVAGIKGKLLHARSAFHLASVHIPSEILQNQEQHIKRKTQRKDHQGWSEGKRRINAPLYQRW